MQDRGRALRIAAALACCVAGWLAPNACEAKLPDPSNSEVPARLVVCPAGDSMAIVIVRDWNQIPWSDGPVWVDFCDCAGFHLSRALSPCTSVDTSSCSVGMTPDPTGTVEIPVSGGGLCPGGSVNVFADGIFLGTLGPPACFDQDGDLRVDSTDVAIVRARLGSHDSSADFDGDGMVTDADLAILSRHLGHESPDHSAPSATSRGAGGR